MESRRRGFVLFCFSGIGHSILMLVRVRSWALVRFLWRADYLGTELMDGWMDGSVDTCGHGRWGTRCSDTAFKYSPATHASIPFFDRWLFLGEARRRKRKRALKQEVCM